MALNKRDERKKALMLYYDEIEAMMQDLSAVEIGTVFKAIAYYDIYGTPIEFTVKACEEEIDNMIDLDTRIVKSWARRFCATLDRELLKYQAQCEVKQSNRARAEQKKYGITGAKQGRFTFETEEGKAAYKLKFKDTYPHEEHEWQMILYKSFTEE